MTVSYTHLDVYKRQILITAVVYFIVLFLIHGIEEDDIRMLPKGDKIFEVMQRMRLFKIN